MSGSGGKRRRGKWSQGLGLATPASQWSTRRRVAYGLFGVLLAVTSFDRAVRGQYERGPWFGVLALLVYAGIFGVSVLVPRHYESWVHRHRELDTALFGPLLFLALGFITPLALPWCAAIAVAGAAALIALGHRRRRLSGAAGSPTS